MLSLQGAHPIASTVDRVRIIYVNVAQDIRGNFVKSPCAGRLVKMADDVLDLIDVLVFMDIQVNIVKLITGPGLVIGK